MPTREQIQQEKQLTKAQKVIIIGALVSAILVFVYSFAFMTPFADLYRVDCPFLFQKLLHFGITEQQLEGLNLPDAAYYYSPFSEIPMRVGLNLAYFTSFTRNELQVTNHWLFNFGFFGLLVSLIPFVYFSQKRKVYYKSNFIVIPAVAAFNMYIGVHMFIQLVSNHMMVLSKGNTYWLVNAYQTYLNDNAATEVVEYFHTSDGNVMFVIGYLIALAVMVFAILGCVIAFLKYRYQKKTPPVDLSQVHINE